MDQEQAQQFRFGFVSMGDQAGQIVAFLAQ